MTTQAMMTASASVVVGNTAHHQNAPQSQMNRPPPPQHAAPHAVESSAVIDAYATRVLHARSPQEACFDSSLGPYVTSVLRGSFEEGNATTTTNGDNCFDMDVEKEIPEYDSLTELLEEHCGMSVDVARSALRSIAVSVRTGIVDPFGEDRQPVYGSLTGVGGGAGLLSSGASSSLVGSLGGGSGAGSSFGSGRPYRSGSVGNESQQAQAQASASDYGDMQMLGAMLRETGLADFPPPPPPSHHHPAVGGVGSDSSGADEDYSGGGSHELNDEAQTSFVLDEDIPGFGNGNGEGGSMPLEPSNKTPGPAVGGGGRRSANNNYNNPSLTPLKPDNLIPVDLLGVLDDPSTPAPPQSKPEEKKEDDGVEAEAGAGVSATAAAAEPQPPLESNGGNVVHKKGNNKGKKKSNRVASEELAASLFRSSRPRSNSIPCEKSPMLRPMVPATSSDALLSSFPLSADGVAPGGVMSHIHPNNAGAAAVPPLFQQQLDSAAQILLSMNGTLGEEAAMEAALISNADVNVAQYVIDGAMSASPVCRHLLSGGCYRSDCSFSHDVDGHTCLFWLRGRCNKGDNCQFLHGFCEKLLDGIKADFLPAQQQQQQNGIPVPSGGPEGGAMIAPTPHNSYAPIQTSNLLQHNSSASFSAPKQGYGAASFLSTSAHDPKSLGAGSFDLNSPFSNNTGGYLGTPTFTSSAAPSRSTMTNGAPDLGPSSFSLSQEPSTGIKASAPAFSFANVASTGYDDASSFAHNNNAAGGSLFKNSSKAQYVKIPQDLWNPSERRDAAVFHIPDPMQRYAEVSASQPRQDVIDLHFQSVKTFAVVLSAVLPEKLGSHGEVWVVTGSGHHVDQNSHQKSGGVLEDAVFSWLDSYGYEYARGRDKNGFGGAVLVRQQ